MPKTGTSVVQNCLAMYAREGDGRVLYSPVGRGAGIAHHALAEAVRRQGPAAPMVDALLAELEADHRPVVISSEAFSNTLGPKIVDALLGFIGRCRALRATQAVLAVREMKSFLESMYLQSSRFGNCRDAVGDYVAARLRWIDGVFEGIAMLRRELGEDLRTPMVTGRFDSVSEIEDAVGVRPGTFASYRSRVASTAKYSWKAQVAFLHLPEIEARVGRPLRRRQIMASLEGGARFEDDIVQYTIIDRDLAASIRRTATAAARRTGFDAYVDAFAEVDDGDAPLRDLALHRLSPADLDLVAALG